MSGNNNQGILKVGGEYEFRCIPFSGCTECDIPRGSLRITCDKGGEKYCAEQCGGSGRFFVKSQKKSSEYALPYALPEIGRFDEGGRTYYVYEQYDGTIMDLFTEGTVLNEWLNARLKGKKDWEKKKEKELIAASVFLKMMFTVRSLYCCSDDSNFDIKAENVVYKIRDDRLIIKVIDFFETTLKSYYHSGLNDFHAINASLTWLSPVLPYISYNRDSNNTIALQAAKYCDIYSMGVMLYWLYSEGRSIWKEPWNSGEHWNATYEAEGSKRMYQYEAVFKKDFLQFYYDSPNRPKDMLRDIRPADFHFAKAPERVAALAEKMLSFPGEYSGSKSDVCDDIISEYCKMLSECGSIPDDTEIPYRYMPRKDIRTGDRSFVITLSVQMLCGDGSLSEWEEYQCLNMSDGDIRNVPITIHRLRPIAGGFREEINDLLFIYLKNNRVYYRTATSLIENRLRYVGSSFGEFTHDTTLEFSLREGDEDTFRLTVCRREGAAIE